MKICFAFVSLAFVAWPGPIVATSSTATATLNPGAVEASFTLQGSHGYSIVAVAYSEEEEDSGWIMFFVGRQGETASYLAPAKLTADSLQADLGSVGRVDVVRRPSGRKKTVHPKCLGRELTYERGTYEGIIEFNGEQGYTRARESRVAQLPSWLFAAHELCSGRGYGETSGPGLPGARLLGVSFAHGRSLSFQVNKNRPSARTLFTASLKERRDGIRIEREVRGTGSPGAFRFDPRLRIATLNLPPPFSGSASLTRSKDSLSPALTGNLALDFPGRANVLVTGSDVHVTLVHARFTRSS